ncbi:ABC transporter permease [Saccharothrix texasensis]|uniref:Autoinducer 2 import system permease protein LsrC n=1 Tax=Saccharothrix texasensis TaxID=103734 RepID=A0A3N1H090_9PSEU|nr:ABC transporter permease [Saccharothrix texasensis]ROP35806.1 monosaccharide ABC transporter membrane protein (CUT2 family) [Saccharothrix texasensis]
MSARPTAPAAPPERADGSRTRFAHRLWLAREFGIVVALGLLVLVTAVDNPAFLSPQSLRDLALGAAVLVVLAVGQTAVIISRNVDLSVGAVLGLAAFATGKLLSSAPGTPTAVVVLVGTGLGAVCGAVNGALVAAARVPALVITLGTLYAFRGVDHSWARGQQVNASDMPRSFLALGTRTVLGVPVLAVIALVVTLVVGFYLRSYRSGRELYAIGSEPVAARLSGIAVGRRVFTSFVLCGALAGLAGVLYAARFGTVDATAGTGIELQVVAAAVVGGVAIFGGSGSVHGAALGALLLTTIGSSLAVLRINPFWQQAVVGGLILAAIGLDRLLAVRAANRLRGRSSHGA